MSVLLERDAAQAERSVEAAALERASRRVRLIKLACMAVLTVCFWYSVPYHFPIDRPDSLAAAAASAAAQSEGSMSREIAVPLIGLIAAYMLWRLPRRGRFTGKLMIVSLLYLAWSAASITWSQAPATTGKRLIVFAVDAFFAFAVARVFSVMEMALWGFSATSIVALISLYADITEGVFAPFDASYRFMGVMEANYQAMNLVVCIVCALTLAYRKPKWLVWLTPAVAFALVLLYLTRSRVSTILCLIMVAILVVRIARARMQAHTRAMGLLATLAIAVPVLILVIGSLGRGAAMDAFMMGRQDRENTASLSNRAPLWSELMESVNRTPLLGVGYQAFWTPARVDTVSLDQGWPVPNAHNTYLDQMLSLGLIGMVLYAAMLWAGCAVAWQRFRRRRSAENLLPALLLSWLALESLAESVPLDPYLPTMLAYACIVKMCPVENAETEGAATQDEMVSGTAQPA